MAFDPLTDPSRRKFIRKAAGGFAGAAVAGAFSTGQELGKKPKQDGGVTVLNPRTRVPVGLIIDDSTCLVNLNRYAMPQFNAAQKGKNKTYQRDWKSWSPEIPDRFVRKFGEWCGENGVKGKYSIVPYPACVGRMDREIPGWSQRELQDSIKLVHELMTPNWDIHPEMLTHTRVIDLKTGQPYPEISPDFMEIWGWTVGKSVDELASYASYSLQILKNIGFTCEGLTTPGGYASEVLPELSKSTGEAVRDVFGGQISHYFRHLFTDEQSVVPRVENVEGLDGDDPHCVVSVVGCTSDWTGGWDNTEPGGADLFISKDLKTGRMVDVIGRGEPAMMVCHWTGMHWNGEEKGFKVFQEVVRRLHEGYENLLWMKLSELSRYWAAKELTAINREGNQIMLKAPFACPDFTLSFKKGTGKAPGFRIRDAIKLFEKVSGPLKLRAGTWCEAGEEMIVCFDLPKGVTELEIT